MPSQCKNIITTHTAKMDQTVAQAMQAGAEEGHVTGKSCHASHLMSLIKL